MSQVGGGNAIQAMLGGTMEVSGFLGGTQQVFGPGSAGAFTASSAGVTFTVAQSGAVVFTITTGTFVASTIDVANGSNQGISYDGTTTYTNNVTINVPNDTMWTNAGGTITATFDAIQPSTASTNGTAAYGGYVNVGSTSGGTQSFTYGSFGAWGPTTGTGPSNQMNVTVTQTRTRNTFTSTTAVTQLQRRTCNQVTAPTGSGSPGTCSMPNNAIGGTQDQTITITAATGPTSVTPTAANGGVQTRTRSVPNTAFLPAFTVANLSLSFSGTNLPNTGLISGSNVATYITAGSNATSVTSLVSTNTIIANPPTGNTRTNSLGVRARGVIPSGFQSAGSNYNFTMTITVTQAATAMMWAQSLLPVAETTTEIPTAGVAAGANASAYATASGTYASSVSSITFTNAIPANTSASDEDVDFTVTAAGTIPAGFGGAGTAYSFNYNLSGIQTAAAPTGTITVDPAGATWNVMAGDEAPFYVGGTSGNWTISASGSASITGDTSGGANADLENWEPAFDAQSSSAGDTGTITLRVNGTVVDTQNYLIT